MSNLKGKIAVITGATGGIGFQVAKRLGKDGYTVILNGIEEQVGAERLEELKNEGITAEYYGFDVTDENQVTSNIKKIGEKYGRIDVLVNNAGGLGGRSRFEEMTTDFYRSVMALNLDSVFFVSRAAIPFLKKGENASIINFTSNAAWTAGGPGAGIYGTSKAGVNTITRALAKDLAEYGIRVNAVSPGTIDTPFHAQIKATKPEVFASWKNNILLGRLGEPEEVASVISFLASKDASFITAETIQIGGGQALGI
jgi:NAD(P)-dependent dehydrogenase (short-subunit alcohol dehydrogenase family)